MCRRVVKLTTVLTKPTHETDLRVGFVKPESLVDPNDGEVGRELRGPCGLHTLAAVVGEGRQARAVEVERTRQNMQPHRAAA